jgi:uncharacterized protein (TIGR02246 family)
MRHLFSTALILAALAVSGCTVWTKRDDVESKRAIKAVLDAQVKAWNEGDLNAFMETYWRSDNLRFASGGTVQKGWAATRERYFRKYPDTKAMGTVKFTVLAVDILGDDAALVLGRYHVKRTIGDLSGLFTLILKKIDGLWVICHDHTSTAK